MKIKVTLVKVSLSVLWCLTMKSIIFLNVTLACVSMGGRKSSDSLPES